MITPDEFEKLIGEALDELPEFFAAAMRNVVVLAAVWPTCRDLALAGVGPGSTLLGLYHGIPLTERGQGYNIVPPDTITLFQGPIERTTAAELPPGDDYQESLRRAIAHTVVHEIAHHFGISDERLIELGAY